MIAKNLLSFANQLGIVRFGRPNRHTFVISRIFKKKQQEKIKQQTSDQQQPEKQQTQEEQKIDDIYFMYERKIQVQLNKDFKQIKNKSSFIPNQINKGGFEEIIYWSQQANTPQSISFVVNNFNKEQIPDHIESISQFLQFKEKVKATVLLIPDFPTLTAFAFFGNKFEIQQQQFWQKIQDKVIRKDLTSHEEIQQSLNIAFLMAKSKQGQYIYNHIQQHIQDKELQLEDQIKFFSALYTMKRGGKEFIKNLAQNILRNIQKVDASMLGQILPGFRQAKSTVPNQYSIIQNQAIKLADTLNLFQICQLGLYFGHGRGSRQMWQILQKRTRQIIQQNKKLSKKHRKDKKLEIFSIFHGILTSYQFSTEFVREIVVPMLREDDLAIIDELAPNSLSVISKILYNYELELQTTDIESKIQAKIMETFKNLDNATPGQLVQVVRDYTVTRHGDRSFYIFLEQVIKGNIQQIKSNPEALRALYAMYQHSSLCSIQLINQLRQLIV